MGHLSKSTLWEIPDKEEATGMLALASAAKVLIDYPGTWTKLQLARSATGRVVNVYSSDAYMFDATGAIQRAQANLRIDDSSYRSIKRIADAFCFQSNNCNLRIYNDLPETTQDDILQLFDSLILVLKAFAHA